jgi:MFS family permease
MTPTTNVTEKSDNTKLGWIVVLAASLYFFYEFIQLNLFNAIDVQLMKAFNLNAAQLGGLSSFYFFANLIFLFPAGILLDRFSTKKILLCAVTLSTLGTFFFSISSAYTEAAISRFVVGIGAACCFLSCIRLASRWFPPAKMALVTGIVVTMAMLGGLVAQTPLALLSIGLGWRNALLLDAALGIVIFILILLWVQDFPPNSEEKVKADKAQLKSIGFFHGLKMVLLNRYNWFGGIYTSLMNLPVFLLGALWGIHYLVQVHGVTVVQASYATTLFFVGIIFGSPAFGWFSDHIGRRVLPMIIGAILSLGVIFILILVPHLSLLSLMTLFFLIGFITSSQVLSYPVIAELNPIALTGTAVSIDSTTIMLSGVIFQPFFGWVMEQHWNHKMVNGVPLYTAADFLSAMLIMPIAFVIALIISFFIKETYCKSQV